jgi:hypothetical protein
MIKANDRAARALKQKSTKMGREGRLANQKRTNRQTAKKQEALTQIHKSGRNIQK